MIQYERDNVSEMRKGQGQHGVLVNSETWQSVQQNHTHLSTSQRAAVEQTVATQDKIDYATAQAELATAIAQLAAIAKLRAKR